MKRIILGTAGHIDHGKTSLVKALTGIDCDRLKEEKQRGITIELGFASLVLPGGQAVGIVDVPGHEKFIKNMVAGTGGIDAVMLVIAADEGVMPQTREHLDICRLLAVRHGLVALTKSDLVDPDWLALVREDIKSFVRGSFLEAAPVIALSSATGAGLPDLLAALEIMIASVAERSSSGIFRMPIDRLFTMKGFGTVVTGTPVAGSIAVGDEIDILPQGIRAKLRGIQVHNLPAEAASAGMRTALNLQGIEKTALQRGSVAAAPGMLATTSRAAAWLDHLHSAPLPLKNRERVRLHAGTAEIGATAILLESDELEPGAGGYVQFVLDEPAVLLPRDRYVIRSFSPVFTIGGGEILDNNPPRLKRFTDASRSHLDTLRQGDTQSAILLFCREAGVRGTSLAKLQARLGIDALAQQLEAMLAGGSLAAFAVNPLQLTLPAIVIELETAVTDALKAYHGEHPLKTGPVREELRARLPRATDARLFSYVLERLEKRKKLTVTNEFLALAEHKPVLKDDEKNLRGAMLGLYRGGGITPPTLKEVGDALKAPPKEVTALLGLLMREGLLVKIDEELYFEAQALDGLIKKTMELAAKNNGEVTLAGFKEVTGLSRKFMIPLLEYFDKTKLTLRVGDKRVLRKQG
jgi:selenocysteine-specific elongation factor